MQTAPLTDPPGEAFDLERFDWAGPDRLEVAGSFAGLGDAPGDAPVLVVHGADRVHRLPAVSDAAAPVDGPWQAAFAWQEAPEPFEAAELELGELTIALPRPGATAPLEDAPDATPESAPDGLARLGLEAELLTAGEQIRELRIEADRHRDELDRAQRELAAERDRRSGDAERFRAGIAQVRASAEEALAAAGAERDRAVAELDELRDQVTRLEQAREEAGAASADAEQLLTRLQALRSALDGSS